MGETEYWSSLEFRICRELAGMSEKGLSKLWCDGVVPEAYLLHDQSPRILGHAWICQGSKQDEWKFELLLPCEVGSRDEIDWELLLPAENVTRWLALDTQKKRLQVEPTAAVADSE